MVAGNRACFLTVMYGARVGRSLVLFIKLFNAVFFLLRSADYLLYAVFCCDDGIIELLNDVFCYGGRVFALFVTVY